MGVGLISVGVGLKFMGVGLNSCGRWFKAKPQKPHK